MIQSCFDRPSYSALPFFTLISRFQLVPCENVFSFSVLRQAGYRYFSREFWRWLVIDCPIFVPYPSPLCVPVPSPCPHRGRMGSLDRFRTLFRFWGYPQVSLGLFWVSFLCIIMTFPTGCLSFWVAALHVNYWNFFLQLMFPDCGSRETSCVLWWFYPYAL